MNDSKNYSMEQEIFEQVKQNRSIKINPELSNPNQLENIEQFYVNLKDHKDFDSEVLIFGDYDVDGIFGSFMLYDYLVEQGYNAQVINSNRKYGYSISDNEIDDILEYEFDLVIMIDCGISSHKEIQRLKENGVDVMVIDHHLQDNPPGVIWINPKIDNSYPFGQLCGAGVVYQIINYQTKPADKYLQLACIATIADLTPLQGDNRWIVKKGLESLNTLDYKPLSVLADVMDVDKWNVGNIAFKIAPAFNAVNRLEFNTLPLELLMGKNLKENAEKLVEYNERRKDIVKNALEEVEVSDEQNIIIYKGNFVKGVTGLIASEIKKEYNKPAIAINQNNYGSGRSISPLHITNALKGREKLFESVGGHKQACGFSLKEGKIEELKDYLYEKTEGIEYKEREVDYTFNSTEYINEKLYNKLQILSPFGIGNPRPYFKISNQYLDNFRTTKTGEHLLITLNGIDGIFFNYDKDINYRKKLDIWFNIGYNDFRNGIQIKVKKVEGV